MQAKRSWLAANEDRVAQPEAGDPKQLVEIGEQHVSPATFGAGRRRHRPKLDVSEWGAQERIAHGLVQKARQLEHTVFVSRLTRHKVHKFPSGVQNLALTGLKSGGFSMIPGNVAAGWWRRGLEMLDEMAGPPDNPVYARP